MPARVLDKRERERILEHVKERFDIEKFNYLLFKTGKEKIRGFSGHLSKEELQKLIQAVNVEIIGLYFFKEEKNNELRLSLDATHLLSVGKNILKINLEQADRWLRGEDLEVDAGLYGFFIIHSNTDFLGCGRAKDGRLVNFIPKERRIR